jgi:hypothetical protein
MEDQEFNELVRTKGRVMAELERDKTPIIESCFKVQLSERIKERGQVVELKTEIIEKRCERINGQNCSACAFPDLKWRNGKCNLATHLYHENKKGEKVLILTPFGVIPEAYIKEQQKLNPIKQSKRGF